MLLFKRLLTTVVLFVVLFFLVFTVTMAVGGGVTGARMAAQNPNPPGGFQQGYQIGLRAGLEFRRQYLTTVRWTALGVALVGAAGLSFTGALPWCRRAPTPPPLPPG